LKFDKCIGDVVIYNNFTKKDLLIKQHIQNFKLDVYEDNNCLLGHYTLKQSKNSKLLVYIRHPQINLEQQNFINIFVNESKSWAHRVFQQQNADFVCLITYDNKETLGRFKFQSFLESLTHNLDVSYQEIIFLIPVDNDEEGNNFLSNISSLVPKANVILYSMNQKLQIPGQTLEPLELQLNKILGFNCRELENEFLSSEFQPMAHWIWNYNLNKNQNWLFK